MKASDVVLQLATLLPKFTDLFTDNFSVASISTTIAGSDLTVTVETTVDHGLSVGQGVRIQGAETPIAISSFTRVGTIGTITTAIDHDFTFGKQGGAISGGGSKNAITSGANEAEFNGSFPITGVPNRRTIQVSMADSGASAATGSPIIENAYSELQTYNGLKQIVSVPSTTTFTYTLVGGAGLLSPVGTVTVKANARISSTLNLESIVSSYTDQLPNKLWGFVVLEDVVASKNRRILSDATDNIQRSNYFRQQIIQPLTFHVVFPTAVQEIAGRQSRDVAEELFKPICNSILFQRFDSLLSVGKYNPLQFLSHGFSFYNGAYYIHQYTFEQVADLFFGDTVGFDEDVAFRDIDLTMGVNVGSGFTSSIDTFANHLTRLNALNSQVLTDYVDENIDETLYKAPAQFEMPPIKASQFAAIRALRLTDGANIGSFVLASNGPSDSFGGPALASKPYFNTPAPDLPLTGTGRGLTETEIEQLFSAGGSVIGNNVAGNSVIFGEVVTTYKNDAAGTSDISFKFLNYVDTASNVREYFYNNLRSRFAQSRLTEGDVIRGRDQANALTIRAFCEGLYQDLSGPDFVLLEAGEEALTFFKNNLNVTIDKANGRATVTMIVPIVTQLREIQATIKIAFSTQS